MHSLARLVGWFVLAAGALLVFVGLSAWPPGGLMFALPFVFLLPGALLSILGVLLILLGRRRTGGTADGV